MPKKQKVCEKAATSMYMFPWSSDKAERGNPLLKCRPSQFCETTCLTYHKDKRTNKIHVAKRLMSLLLMSKATPIRYISLQNEW